MFQVHFHPALSSFESIVYNLVGMIGVEPTKARSLNPLAVPIYISHIPVSFKNILISNTLLKLNIGRIIVSTDIQKLFYILGVSFIRLLRLYNLPCCFINSTFDVLLDTQLHCYYHISQFKLVL